MLRRVMVLLATPAFVIAAQGPASGEVQVPVSTAAVSVSLSSDAYQLIERSGTGKEELLRGHGALVYALAAGSELSIAAMDSAASIRIELKDQGRTVAFASGRTVTLRRRDGLVSVEARKDGPLAPTPRPPGHD